MFKKIHFCSLKQKFLRQIEINDSFSGSLYKMKIKKLSVPLAAVASLACFGSWDGQTRIASFCCHAAQGTKASTATATEGLLAVGSLLSSLGEGVAGGNRIFQSYCPIRQAHYSPITSDLVVSFAMIQCQFK